MAFKKKQKSTYNPYAKQIHAMLEAEKARRKKLRGFVVFKNEKTSAEYKSSGIFLDEAELNDYAKSYCKSLNESAKEPGWLVVEVKFLNNEDKDYEKEEDEVKNED